MSTVQINTRTEIKRPTWLLGPLSGTVAATSKGDVTSHATTEERSRECADGASNKVLDLDAFRKARR